MVFGVVLFFFILMGCSQTKTKVLYYNQSINPVEVDAKVVLNDSITIGYLSDYRIVNDRIYCNINLNKSYDVDEYTYCFNDLFVTSHIKANKAENKIKTDTVELTHCNEISEISLDTISKEEKERFFNKIQNEFNYEL